MTGTLLSSKQEEPHHPPGRSRMEFSTRQDVPFQVPFGAFLFSTFRPFERGAHRQDSKSTVLSGQEGS